MKNIFRGEVSFRKMLAGLATVLAVFSLAFAAPSGIALADTPTPGPKTRDYSALTKAYQNEQKWLGIQQGNLNKTGTVVSRVQDLISKAQAKGLDTSALSSALATFQSQIATAQGSDATAASILSAHNGFDGNGNVTDPDAARQTVENARQSLAAARSVLLQATGDLHAAVKAWEQANRDNLQDQALQKIYQREQDWLTKQASNLGKTGDIVTKVQDLITKAKAKGIDTSALEAALATFQSQIATAQAAHNTAAGILSAHNGFDGSGKVTDPTAARQTVKDAGQALKDAHSVLTQAVQDLRKAIQEFRDKNGAAAAIPTPSGL